MLSQVAAVPAAADWNSDFQEQYPAAARVLKDAYTDLSTTEAQYRIKDGVRTLVERFKYTARGSSIRVERMENQKGSVEIETARVLTDDHAFKVRKSPGLGEYALEEMSEKASPGVLASVRTSLKIPTAAYCILELTIQEFMAEPGFQVVDAVETNEGSEKLVKVSWENPLTRDDGKVLRRNGWFLFAPDRHWALYGYSYAFAPNSETSLHGRISYDGERDGVPLVSRAEYWTQRGDERTDELVAERTALDLSTPSKAAFTMDSFKVNPEVLARAENRAWMYWVIAGVLGVALAGLLARWAKRRT